MALIYPDFNFRFEIENSSGQDTEITVLGNEMLLKIVSLNLLKNAIIYSDDHSVECLLLQQKATLSIVITNSGEVPKLKDPAILFSSFYRGSNIRNTPGSGMGLAIAKRVLQYHEATITYQAPHYNFNQFTVTFPQQFEVHSY